MIFSLFCNEVQKGEKNLDLLTLSTKYVSTSPDVLLLQVCILCWKQANLNKTLERKVVQRSRGSMRIKSLWAAESKKMTALALQPWVGGWVGGSNNDDTIRLPIATPISLLLVSIKTFFLILPQ